MDVVSVAVATGAAKALAEPQHTAAFLSKLDQNQSDVVLGVLGDSTSNNVAEWAYLLAQHLASRYPAYTVTYRLWNDGGQVYDSPSTLQTGSGSHTLAVYNASTPGTVTSYAVSRISTMLPVAPDLVMINYGHNSTGVTAFRTTIFSLLRTVSDYWPRANIIQIAQNPRTAADAEQANDLIRQQQVIEAAAAENTGVVNVMQRFLDYGDFAADLMTDDLHPNDAGQLLWLDEVKKHFRRAPQTAAQGPIPRATRVFLPAAQFLAGQGTPDLAVRASVLPAWALDASTQESVIGVTDIPSTWGSVNIYVVWTTNGGSTNAVKWQLGRAYISGLTASIPGTTPSSFITDGTATDSAYTDQLRTRVITVKSDQAYTGRPLVFEVTRLAADAADTLTQDAWLSGLLIERAS